MFIVVGRFVLEFSHSAPHRGEALLSLSSTILRPAESDTGVNHKHLWPLTHNEFEFSNLSLLDSALHESPCLFWIAPYMKVSLKTLPFCIKKNLLSDLKIH